MRKYEYSVVNSTMDIAKELEEDQTKLLNELHDPLWLPDTLNEAFIEGNEARFHYYWDFKALQWTRSPLLERLKRAWNKVDQFHGQRGVLSKMMDKLALAEGVRTEGKVF